MKEMVCIVCPRGCRLTVGRAADGWTVRGNSCPKGEAFAVEEITNPKRSIASTVRTAYKEFPRLPVRTDGEIPLRDVVSVMASINRVKVSKPLHIGEIVIENVCGTGVNIIAEADLVNELDS